MEVQGKDLAERSWRDDDGFIGVLSRLVFFLLRVLVFMLIMFFL